MLPLRALFDDLAKEETRVLHVAHGQSLPQGAYLFMEAYCTEPGCDCRRVLIQVLHAETKRQAATINYAFEPSEAPFDDEPQVFIDPMNPQSEHSDHLQDAFETLMLTDTAYVGPGASGRPPKVGPNELCPCGSGKKFKKCCMGKVS